MLRLAIIATTIGTLHWCSFADAGYVYATAIDYDASSPRNAFWDDPIESTLGPPDGSLTQFFTDGVLTLDFGSVLSGPGTLSIYTYDNPYPAAAQVEISTDGSLYSLLAARIWDNNGDPGPPYPHVDLAITSPFRFVRITDIEAPDRGFDLDAVAYLADEAQPVPEPATLTLFGLGALGLAIRRRRSRTPRSIDRC